MNEANAILQREMELSRLAIRPQSPQSPQSGQSPQWPQFLVQPQQENRRPTGFAQIIATQTGNNTVISGSSGLVVEILEIQIWNSGVTQTISFRDGANTDLFVLTNFPGATGYNRSYSEEPHFTLTSGNGFVLNLSAGSRVDGYVKYRIR